MTQVERVTSRQQGTKDRPDNRQTPKKRRRKRLLIGSAFLAGAIIVPPALDYGNTARVWDALRGNQVSCVDTSPAGNYKADVIAVPGATSIRTKDGRIIPNQDEQTRLTAAAIEYANGKAPTIALLGRPSNVDADDHTNAEITFLQQTYNELTGDTLPASAVIWEMDSTSTKGNMKRLSRKIDSKSVAEIVTNKYHVGRATVLACQSRVNAFGMSAEDIIEAQDPELLKKLNPHGQNSGSPWKENGGIIATLYPGGDTLARIIYNGSLSDRAA